MHLQKYFETFAGATIVAYNVDGIPRRTVGRVNTVLNSGLLYVYWHDQKMTSIVDPVNDDYKVYKLCAQSRAKWVERQKHYDKANHKKRKTANKR